MFFFANALRQDIFIVKFKKAAGVTHANKYETDWMNMPHIKAGNRRVDGIFSQVMRVYWLSIVVLLIIL